MLKNNLMVCWFELRLTHNTRNIRQEYFTKENMQSVMALTKLLRDNHARSSSGRQSEVIHSKKHLPSKIREQIVSRVNSA